MVVCGAEHGVEARSVSDMAEHEPASMACSLPQEQPETSGAGAACWGTCEELLLVSAVKRHGVDNWNLISSELKARAITLNVSPLYFSETACKHKYDVLRGRFASCSSSTMSQDEEVGNDMHWFEELRKIRVAHLKRELEHYDGSIGSLQVKIKRLKAEKAGDISANKQLGKSIANPQPNDQVPETSSCEVPVQCSSIDGEFGNDLSKISSLKPCSHHLKASLALDTEKNLYDNPLIQGPVNLQHVIRECDQWHDAVEELKDASPGPTDITADADVHRDFHQLHNATQPSNLDLGVERDDGTVSLADTVTIEPQLLSGGWVDELQGVEAAGVAASSQVDENMKLPGKSEQADTEQSKHLVDKSAESLSRDHEAGLLVLDSVNEDIAKVGVEGLHTAEQGTQELVQDESIIVQPDPRLEGDDRTLSATADAISNMDTCEDGGTVYPNDSDLRIHAVGHSIVSPNSSLLGPQSSGSMTFGEAGDKQPEIFTILEEKATPSNSQQNVYELQRETLENVVDNAILQKETDSEAGLSTQSHAVLAVETEHDHNTEQISSPILEHDNMGDAQDLHRIDESPSDLTQDAKVDEIISSEPLSEISKFHEDLPNVQVLKEVSTSGLESAGTGPESDTAAAEVVRNEKLGVSGVVPVVKCESWMRPDGAMVMLEKPGSEESAMSSGLLYPSNADLKSSSPEGRIVIALDEPNDNVPSCGSKSVPPTSAEEKMVRKVDMYIGSDAVSDVEAESMEGKEQLVAPACQDFASGEYDGNNTAQVSSANAMELLREVYGPDRASELPLISVELVPKPEPEKTAATSELSLPSVLEASKLSNSGPAISDHVENGMQMVGTTSKVVDDPRTSELVVETDLGQVVEDSEMGHIVENVEHIDSHAVMEEHLDTGGNQLEAGDAYLKNAKTGLPSSHCEESVSLKLVPHHTEEEYHQLNNGRKNVKESPLAAVPSISGSLPDGHTEIDPASNYGRDTAEFQVASIDKERKLQGIILDVKLEISKEESLEVQTSVSKQLSEVISEGSRGRDLDISSLGSPNAAEGRDQSDRGLVMESTELKPSTIGPAKVKEEIIDYVRDRDLQEIRGSAPKSGIKPKAEPSSPDESLAGGLESKMPSSHEGSDSVQEQYKDGGDQSGEGEERQQRAQDYGESQIDKSEAGSPVDGNDEMSPSSRRNRREPRVPGKLVPLLEVLRNICNHKSAYLFKGRPEDPRYNLLIRRHLDLTIVRARLEEGAYSGSSEFFRDLLLIFNNAMVFYASGSTEFLGAKALFAEATKELDRICQTEALLKRDGPATRTRELKKPKTVAAGVVAPARVVTPSPIGGISSGKLVGSNPSVTSLPDNGSRKRASTRLGTLETSTNSESVVDSECGAARSASVNIFGGPSTSRAEEARDSHDDDQEVNGSLKGGKKLHVGGGSSRRIARQEELQEGMSLKNGVNKASGRAKSRDIKDAVITKGPALSAKAAVGAKLRAERETERKREKEREKEKEKVKVRERDDIDDDDFLLRKGKSLAKLKDPEIVQERVSDTKPASKARASTAVRSTSNSQDILAQSLGRPVRGARKSASSAKEPGRLPEQPAKKRARK